MATVVSRRLVPPRHERVVRPATRAEFEGSAFIGLTYAVPLGILIWLGLALAVRSVV